MQLNNATKARARIFIETLSDGHNPSTVSAIIAQQHQLSIIEPANHRNHIITATRHSLVYSKATDIFGNILAR